ncbi:hypothetical protein OSB04_008646 [Centaurea solstitialis]|uniref:Ferredoxin thioredoxin reductase alpha chain domain-containing protein n=1 Tax=Centaurea solstitialis TaxID=347529 RepID=A0AA38TXQ6_9ASTR|nr:hypothetical protein OSB04_008646 [Centaurea solstitialis]
MTSPAIFSAATAINLPPSTAKNRLISPFLCACASDSSPSLTKINNKRSNLLLPSIKAAASDSTAIVDGPTQASTSEEETEIPAKIGARVRVTVPLKVYHVPKVPEVELNGKEGKVKEYVALWKGKNISATFPYKIEFLEKLEGRGDKPVKFFVHLKEEEFEYID